VAPQRSEDKDYELLTQAVYQAILSKDGHQNIEVEHDVELKGRSAATHQVDVYWRFKQAGVEHKVLVECKNYSRKSASERSETFNPSSRTSAHAKELWLPKLATSPA
jgi:hypothetical protein